MSPTTPFSTLARALARGTRPGDLLPELHRELLAATGGCRSVVLEAAGPTGDYMATSGRGFTALDALWVRDVAADALRSLAAAGARLVDLTVAPVLAAQLAADRALLVPVPLARRDTIVLVVGPDLPDAEAIEVAARAAVEFGIVLEWSGLAREGSFHRRMRELSLVFTRGVRSTASMGPALEIVAHEANALFGTRRTSVWLHDRRARELELTASSDPAAAVGARLATDAPGPAARGLLIDRPEIVSARGGRMLIAPLRGWRRALGALVIDGAAAVDDEQLVELGHELGRQLAAGIENVQLLDEVLRQRRLLEDTFNSLTDLVIVTDSALRVVQVNDACTAALSQSRDDLIGRDLHEVAGAAVAGWVSGDGDGSRAAGDRTIRARTFEDASLPGIFAMTAAPLVTQDEDTAGWVVVARDITSQSRLEADREALGQRLAQSEKLAALGQFVAGIAHEMNNPLQGILGHLELLIDHTGEARPVRRELRRVYREAERASRTVHNLLVFTGSRRMKRRRLRVERVVARALASRRAALERAGIEVVRRFPEDLPTVTGDPLLLQQAFLNVVINAEHAVDGAGAGRIEITGTHDDERVHLTIRDNGPGLAEDLLPRLFEPFFTTKDVGKGTGLGLAITYGIVQEHGGQIYAANAPGGGALFRLTFPVSVDVR